MFYAISPVLNLKRQSNKKYLCFLCQFCFDTVPICFNLDVFMMTPLNLLYLSNLGHFN